MNVDRLPRHSVVITVTSDSAIPRLGYRVAYGKPDVAYAYKVRSPVRIEAIARGYGPLAGVAAQAGPYSTTITCTISVDGTVRSTRTMTQPYSVIVCLV